MPKLDGWQVCELLKAKEKTSDIPVVMCTALDKITDVDKGFRLGANAYIVKPFNTDKIVGEIEKILGGGVE